MAGRRFHWWPESLTADVRQYTLDATRYLKQEEKFGAGMRQISKGKKSKAHASTEKSQGNASTENPKVNA